MVGLVQAFWFSKISYVLLLLSVSKYRMYFYMCLCDVQSVWYVWCGVLWYVCLFWFFKASSVLYVSFLNNSKLVFSKNFDSSKYPMYFICLCGVCWVCVRCCLLYILMIGVSFVKYRFRKFFFFFIVIKEMLTN